MGRIGACLLGLSMVVGLSPVKATDGVREPTDIAIRRQVGLPPESARGQIEILDVGHGPMDTMLSIVARRTGRDWRVSYACAGSPACYPHSVQAYTLSPDADAQVDAILKRLRDGEMPDGQPPSSNVIGGYLTVTINDGAFRQRYDRVGQWGKVLGGLRQLLAPPPAPA